MVPCAGKEGGRVEFLAHLGDITKQKLLDQNGETSDIESGNIWRFPVLSQENHQPLKGDKEPSGHEKDAYDEPSDALRVSMPIVMILVGRLAGIVVPEISHNGGENISGGELKPSATRAALPAKVPIVNFRRVKRILAASPI